MFKQVRLHDAILKFYQRSQPIAFSNAETLYDDLVLLRDQILMYGDLSEAQTNYLNDFIDKFDSTLPTTIRNIFEKWLNDGFLSDFIRDLINEEVIDSRDGESNLNLRLNRDKQDSDTKINLLQEKDNQITAQLSRIPNYLQNITNINSVKMIAHRGFSEGAPENTIPAIEQAGKLGYWGVEFDVMVTSDGEWVSIHDDTVNRTTDGIGLVKEYTLSELQALTVIDGNNVALYPNLKIPTLDDMLRTCKKYNLVPLIEIKERDYIEENYSRFLSILQRWGYEEKAIVNSFRHEPINALRNLSDKLTFAVIGNITDYNIDFVQSLGSALLSAPLSDINTTNVLKCYTAGVTLCVWTVNNANELSRVSNLGVDYVATDKLLGSNEVKN